jgi:UDP-glucuronate decarboxylase
MKKIVVTGCTGFIGSYCLDLLKKKNYDIYAITIEKRAREDKVHWIELDLFNFPEVKNFLNSVQADLLLHLAWITTPGIFYESPLNENWYEASRYLVDSFLTSGGQKVAIAGSCAEYDWNTKTLDEESIPLPQSLYGKTKVKLYSEVKKLSFKKNSQLIWGRIFNVYGPGEPQQKIIPLLINAALANKKIDCETKKDVRDFIYVKDVANIFVHLLERDFNGIINVSTGKGTSIEEIAKIIEQKLTVSSICNFKKDNSKYPQVIGFSEKLKNLKYNFLYDLPQGLEETIRWWRGKIQS